MDKARDRTLEFVLKFHPSVLFSFLLFLVFVMHGKRKMGGHHIIPNSINTVDSDVEPYSSETLKCGFRYRSCSNPLERQVLDGDNLL